MFKFKERFATFTHVFSYLSVFMQTVFVQLTEVELFWRRPDAPSVALRGVWCFLRLVEFVIYNRAAIGGPSKRQPMNLLVSSCLG